MRKKNMTWTLLTLTMMVVFAINSTAYGAGAIDKELKKCMEGFEDSEPEEFKL